MKEGGFSFCFFTLPSDFCAPGGSIRYFSELPHFHLVTTNRFCVFFVYLRIILNTIYEVLYLLFSLSYLAK